ncbi:hypothetical protein BDZ89DRAFT_520322 [Hymenopellis radicata]|nr:hypothetical protein BDZ89DRAFT_520322 [Hymenopellis radicata]
MSGTRRSYTNTEDNHLAEFIALHNPDGVGRKGNKLYEELVNDPKARPWSKAHSAQSWRDRYVKNQDTFNPSIRRYIQKRKAEKKEKEKTEEERSPTRKRKRSLETTSPENTKVPRKIIKHESPRHETETEIPVSIPSASKSSLYPDISSLQTPQTIQTTKQPEPKKIMRRRQRTPDRDSGFCETSPSVSGSPRMLPRHLPRMSDGPFGNRLKVPRKVAASSDDEDVDDLRAEETSVPGHKAGRQPSIPLVSSQPKAQKMVLPSLVAARLASKKRAAIKAKAAEPPTAVQVKAPRSDVAGGSVKSYAALTAFNKPGESSRVTLDQPLQQKEARGLPPSDNDPFVVSAPIRPRIRRHTEIIPHIDLQTIQRRKSLPNSRISDQDVLLQRGISSMIADWSKTYHLTEACIRPVWQAFQDIRKTEKVLDSMRQAAEREMKKGISSFNHRRASGSRSKLKEELRIVPLSDDDEVDGAYEPPSQSRAGKFLKLSKRGMIEEAMERDQRRASGGRRRIASRLQSSPIKQETPSPPERLVPRWKIWGPKEDQVLRSLTPQDLSEGRKLQERFGVDMVLEKIHDVLFKN